MAVNEIWFDHDLQEDMKVKTIPASIFMDDDKANLIGVRIFNNRVPYTLSGYCTYNVLRADGSTVYGSGVIEENKAYATLPAAAYRVPGRTVIFIRVRENDHTSVMLAVSVITIRSRTDTIIDPEDLIPSIEDILEQYDRMIVSIDEADAATQEATEAAELARAKADLAESMAALAQQKAEYADEKGQLAYEAATIASAAAALAVRKAELADAAAQNADEKAALANTKAELADEKAGLANTAAGTANAAAQNADQKAGLANTAANTANAAAQNADQKAGLANTAAQNADEKATLANEKAGLANTAANNANAKAELADQKATLANQKAELADQKATAANDAADRANTAAGKLEGITVDGQTVNPDVPADARISQVDGHYHIDFDIPKGETAAIVSRTYQYQQSASGSTIPTGTWSDVRPEPAQGMYVWTKIHTVWNNGQERDDYNVGGRNGVDGMGSVISVEGISPDPNGNVALNLENRFYTKQQTYTKEEVDQKISDESFFFVNESGQLCQKIAEAEEEQEG